MKQCDTCNGYKRVALSKNKKVKFYYIHRLVAITYIDNPENKPFVNHIDFNTTNNLVSNLEWCTPYENVYHTIKHNRHINPPLNEGINHPKAKLKKEDVINIRKLHECGFNYVQISDILKVKKDNIGRVIRGQSYKCIKLI